MQKNTRISTRLAPYVRLNMQLENVNIQLRAANLIRYMQMGNANIQLRAVFDQSVSSCNWLYPSKYFVIARHKCV